MDNNDKNTPNNISDTMHELTLNICKEIVRNMVIAYHDLGMDYPGNDINNYTDMIKILYS